MTPTPTHDPFDDDLPLSEVLGAPPAEEPERTEIEAAPVGADVEDPADEAQPESHAAPASSPVEDEHPAADTVSNDTAAEAFAPTEAEEAEAGAPVSTTDMPEDVPPTPEAAPALDDTSTDETASASTHEGDSYEEVKRVLDEIHEQLGELSTGFRSVIDRVDGVQAARRYVKPPTATPERALPAAPPEDEQVEGDAAEKAPEPAQPEMEELTIELQPDDPEAAPPVEAGDEPEAAPPVEAGDEPEAAPPVEAGDEPEAAPPVEARDEPEATPPPVEARDEPEATPPLPPEAEESPEVATPHENEVPLPSEDEEHADGSELELDAIDAARAEAEAAAQAQADDLLEAAAADDPFAEHADTQSADDPFADSAPHDADDPFAEHPGTPAADDPFAEHPGTPAVDDPFAEPAHATGEQPFSDALLEPEFDQTPHEAAVQDESHAGEFEDLSHTEVNVTLPPGSPLAEMDDLPEPETAPAGIDDYVPAYAEHDQEEEAQHVPAQPPLPPSAQPEEPPLPASTQAPEPVAPEPTADDQDQPMDILYAIAIRDPELQSEQRSTQVLANIRSGAIEEGKRGKREKIKLPGLPLDQLVRGTPVVATVYAPSGGVGKSSVSLNLAAYIAEIGRAMAKNKMDRGEENVRVPRVLVLDGDMVRGSLAIRLTGVPSPSIHKLMLYLDERKDAGYSGDARWPRHYEEAPAPELAMRDFVKWRNDQPNLNLLASPEDPDLFYDFGPSEYREILQLLGRFYDVIIIDSGTEIIMESTRAWLQHANEVFLITAPEIDRIYNAAKDAQLLVRSRPHPRDTSPNPAMLPPLVTPDKLSVVMTKYDADSGLDPDAVMRDYFGWLSDEQKFYIPDLHREMLRANNQGQFLVLKNATYAKALAPMAQHLFQRYQASRQRAIESS